jgi:hypothetical protein
MFKSLIAGLIKAAAYPFLSKHLKNIQNIHDTSDNLKINGQKIDSELFRFCKKNKTNQKCKDANKKYKTDLFTKG